MSAGGNRSGFTLIEVMVALVIMSLGLLGLATMQLTGLRNTSNAYYRTQASVLANDLIERIHANTGAGYLANALPNCTVFPVNYCARNGATAADACNATQMATHDMFTVACGSRQGAGVALGGIDDLLPNGTLQVRSPPGGAAACAPEVQCEVIVGWSEVGDGGVINAQNVTVVFMP